MAASIQKQNPSVDPIHQLPSDSAEAERVPLLIKTDALVTQSLREQREAEIHGRIQEKAQLYGVKNVSVAFDAVPTTIGGADAYAKPVLREIHLHPFYLLNEADFASFSPPQKSQFREALQCFLKNPNRKTRGELWPNCPKEEFITWFNETFECNLNSKDLVTQRLAREFLSLKEMQLLDSDNESTYFHELGHIVDNETDFFRSRGFMVGIVILLILSTVSSFFLPAVISFILLIILLCLLLRAGYGFLIDQSVANEMSADLFAQEVSTPKIREDVCKAYEFRHKLYNLNQPERTDYDGHSHLPHRQRAQFLRDPKNFAWTK